MTRKARIRLRGPLATVAFAAVLGVLIISTSCDEGGESIWSTWDVDYTVINHVFLPVSRTSWHIAAEPYQLEGEGYARGKLLWHTPWYMRSYEEVYGTDNDAGEGTLRTLRFIFRPVGSGTKSWAGVTTSLNRTIPDSIDCFDVRVYGDRGLVHVDFGIVNEDVNGDGFCFNEDIDGNGYVDFLEDMGLDATLDDYYEEPSIWGTDDDLAGDNWYFRGLGKCPFGDGCDTIDWDSDEWRFEFLNGTEGNRFDPSYAGLPDKECLRAGRAMTTTEALFSWTINLAGDDFLVEGSEINSWRTLRLPIGDGSPVDTVVEGSVSPGWEHLEHVRIWFEADESQTVPDTVEIADWHFVSDPD